jgi:hypothetical protein
MSSQRKRARGTPNALAATCLGRTRLIEHPRVWL